MQTWMRDSGRPVAWDRLSRRLMPGYGSVSKVARRSSTCSLEKLVLFLRLALRTELPLLEATGRASSVWYRQMLQWQQHLRHQTKNFFPLKTSWSYSWTELQIQLSARFEKFTAIIFTVRLAKIHVSLFTQMTEKYNRTHQNVRGYAFLPWLSLWIALFLVFNLTDSSVL